MLLRRKDSTRLGGRCPGRVLSISSAVIGLAGADGHRAVGVPQQLALTTSKQSTDEANREKLADLPGRDSRRALCCSNWMASC